MVSSSSSVTAAASSSAGHGLNELVVGYTSSEGFNPYLVNSTLISQNAGLLFEKLVEYSPDMALEYRVAEAIECSGTTVVLHVRGGLCFADGTPITAEDAAASLTAAKNSGMYSGRFSNVESVTVQNGAVILTLAQPDSLFACLCDIPVLKADEVGTAYPTASGRYTYGTNCLVRNPRDSLSTDGPSEIGLCDVAGYDEMVSGLAMGDLNVYTASDHASVSASMTSQETYYHTNNLVFLGVNAEKDAPLLNTPLGRSLLCRLMDRRALAEKSYYSRAYPATGALNCYYSCVRSQQVISAQQDADGMADIMAALGYERDAATGYYRNPLLDDSSLQLLVYSNSTYKKYAATLIQSQLAALGIEVRLTETSDFSAYTSAVAAGEFDLYIGEVKLYNNMDLSPFWTDGAVSMHLAQNEELAAAYAAFRENKSAAGNFEAVFAGQAPYIPLVWRFGTVVTAQNVEGLNCSLSNVFYSLQALNFKS